MKKAILSALALALIVGASATASAECNPILGTSRQLVARQAVAANSKLYGAISLLDNHLLPRLSFEDDHSWNLVYTQNAIYNVIDVPATGCDEAQPLSLHSLDMAASAWGVGYRFNPATFYYAVGVTGVGFTPWGPFGRWVFPPLLGYAGFGYSLLAPVTGSAIFEEDSFVLSFDFVAGMDVDLWNGADLSVGYIGSQGVYAQLRSEPAGLFSDAAITEGFDELVLLRVGLSNLDWLLSKEVLDAIGTPLVYGRLIQWVASPNAGINIENLDEATLNRTDVTTLHYDQWNIAGGWFDLRGAWRLEPDATFHNASLAFHHPAFVPLEGSYRPSDPQATHISLERERGTRKHEMGKWYVPPWRFVVGVFNAPDLFFYGTPGGLRFQAALELRDNATGLALRYNGDQVLENFPYAADTFQIQLFVNGDI